MREQELERLLDMKKNAKVLHSNFRYHTRVAPLLGQIKLGGDISQARRVVEDCREQYDQLTIEDKVAH